MSGAARVMDAGTSLVNSGVHLFLSERCRAPDIAILTYYNGQKYLITQKLREVKHSKTTRRRDWNFCSLIISSVDSYWGQE